MHPFPNPRAQGTRTPPSCTPFYSRRRPGGWAARQSLRSLNRLQWPSRLSCVLVLVGFLGLLVFLPTHAIEFDVPPSNSKCVQEDISVGVLVLGEWFVVEPPQKHASVTVSAPSGELLYSMESSENGHFGFSAKETGYYKACFWATAAENYDHTLKLSIHLDWRTGVAAKDWASIAKRDNLRGLEVELMQLEETVKYIHDEILYMKHREEQLRDISEAVNQRVAWFSAITLFVCVSLAVCQLYYLRSFFERKKLL